MPFPFLWIGALVAAAFLTFVFTLFGLLMKLLNRATPEVRESILPGLVTGIRDWADGHGLPLARVISPGAGDDGSMLEPWGGGDNVRLEPVQRAR